MFGGILAPSCAGHTELAWYSEVNPFASSVAAHHYPGVPNLGDCTTVDLDTVEPVDLITAGWPCQDLSVAGLRKGLAGERSGLFWEVIRFAERLRPRWLLLENVPGLLSANNGRDFGIVLSALDDLGYGLAWRVLDAQFFGVPQRRRRVFIVGHLGAPCPAEILFEREGMSRDSAAGRKAGTRVTGSVAACLNSGGNNRGFRSEPGEHIVVSRDAVPKTAGGVVTDLRAGNPHPSVVIAPLTTKPYADSEAQESRIVAFHHKASVSQSMNPSDKGNGSVGGGVPFLTQCNAPRRLTPTECERLQGFPDGWTDVRYQHGKGEKQLSDSSRYRLLGNSMAVPCVGWILERLVRCDRALREAA